MRPIDADWLKELYQPYESYNGKELAVPIGAILANIDDAPTIDAVSVVRCKECKHNPKYTNDYMYGRCVFCCEDDYYSGTPSDDFYCRSGEREGE